MQILIVLGVPSISALTVTMLGLNSRFVVTPICSHSLTQRPLVLPREFRLEFRSNDDVVVLIDGHDRFDLIEFDSVDIGVTDIRVNLLRQKGRDYFGVLKEKLRWGQQI